MHNNVIFNGTDWTKMLGVQITGLNFHTRAKRTMNRKALPRDDGQKLVTAVYQGKEIIIHGIISATSKILFETYRDAFFATLSALESTLSVVQAGATAYYTGSVDDIAWDEDPKGGFGQFTLTFISSKPYREVPNYATARNLTGITVGNTTNGIGTILGSYKAAPRITVTITSVSGATSKYIKLTNPATGKYIQITRTWANSDSLVIDADAKTVKVNGVAVDFAGVFLEYDPGTAQIKYEDNFTSRNVAVLVEYKQRDL